MPTPVKYSALLTRASLEGTTFVDIPNGLAAITAIPAFGWFQIAASIGYWEIFGWQQVEGANPGDFGYGNKFFGEELSGDKLIEKQTKELQNGRLAMVSRTYGNPIGQSYLDFPFPSKYFLFSSPYRLLSWSCSVTTLKWPPAST